nr:hypothetical protein [uncultured Agathobaculum sp.]
MKLKDKCKPSIPPIEPDVYMAVCTIVADVGEQYSEKYKNTNNQVLLAFDIPDIAIEVNGENKPRQLSKRYTYSTDTRSNLNKILCSWLNKKFSEDELRELELFDLLGRGCQVQVTLKEDGKHNDIANVMALPRGMKTPETVNPYLAYDIDKDGFTGEKWDALPEWLRNIIEQSEQYQKNPPEKVLEMPDDTTSEECPI